MGVKKLYPGTSENKEGMKMRKVLLGLLIAAALLVTEAYASQPGSIKGPNVPLWEGPSNQGAILHRFQGDERVFADKIFRVPGQTGWVRVRFGNLTGWVRADLVRMKDPGELPPYVPPKPDPHHKTDPHGPNPDDPHRKPDPHGPNPDDPHHKPAPGPGSGGQPDPNHQPGHDPQHPSGGQPPSGPDHPGPSGKPPVPPQGN